ncbi:MAG: alpha-2-macroglobulin family protein, partial [Duodenibacillus sp.]|nr:alpha-2-macroglobulin family protein [Duodenibacillus sp.]
ADYLAGATAECTVELEGFEADGGRAVSKAVTALVSPQPFMVGCRSRGAATNLQFIGQGSPAELDFVAVGPDLKRVDAGELDFVVYERRYVTSLVTDSQGRYRYDETPLDTQASSGKVALGAAGAAWRIPTAKAGDFLLAVKDKAGRTLSLVPFSVAGNSIADGSSLASSVLRLKSDKASYQSGETMKLALSAPYDGMGLITIEREGVAAAKWFTAKAGESVQEIALPAGFEGRGYAVVTFMRSVKSPDIYIEPSATTAVPFTASAAKRDMGLSVTAPERALPGADMQVSVASKVPGKAFVFAVDEGVLQLTRYKTPDPVAALLNDRALDVSTLHAFSRLMPDAGLLAGRIPGFGGDMAANAASFHNPFGRKSEPPLATWTLADVGPGAKPVAVPVPAYYSGTVRVMAVAASAEAAGSAQQKSVVTAPLAVQPRLPLAVCPGDAFEASVILSNTTAAPMKARLALSQSALQVLSAPQGDIDVPANGQKAVALKLAAPYAPGAVTVTFTAEAGAEKTVRETSLSVRPATHNRVTQASGVIAKGEGAEVSVGRELFGYEAVNRLSVAAAPVASLKALAGYVENYPWDCLEQTISRALPAALLSKHPELLPRDGKDRAKLIEAAVAKIQANKRYDGVAPWEFGEADPLLTAYAADFLLTLREQGIGMNDGLIDELGNAIMNHVENVRESPEALDAAAYGVWVLTRMGHVTTQMIERLDKKRDSAGCNARNTLAQAMIAASQKVMRVRRASAFSEPQLSGEGSMMNDLAAEGLFAYVTARYFPENVAKQHVVENLASDIAQAQRAGRAATFASAQALRALAEIYLQGPAEPPAVTVACKQPASVSGQTGEAEGPAVVLSDPSCAVFTIGASAGGQPLYWQLETRGYDTTPPAKAVSQGLALSRVYLNAQGQPVTSARQGEVLTVKLAASSTSGKAVANCALVDMLPGGFEMVLPRAGEGEDLGGFQHMDRREDRMVLFGTVGASEATFAYKVRAVNKGDFALPAAQIEGMYDGSKHANTAGGRFVVR